MNIPPLQEGERGVISFADDGGQPITFTEKIQPVASSSPLQQSESSIDSMFVLVAILSLGVTIFWMVLGSRAVRALETLAAATKTAAD